MTLTQTPEWGANKWQGAGDLTPGVNDGDAGVFLSPADGDYWYFNANSGGGQYRAYHSTNMVNWTSHGNVTGKDWVTSAEYANGQFFIYYDEPNDEDPHLIVFDNADDLRNGIRNRTWRSLC